MTRYRLAEEVAKDLAEIWDFIAPDDELAADKFIAELLELFARIGDSPRIGRRRDDLIRGLRSLPHGDYLVFYTIKHEIVEILRCIHGARDLDAIFRHS